MKLLVGYDGSSVAKAALELARQHATTWNAKIEVANCMHQNQKLKYEDIRKVEQNLDDEVHAIMNSGKVSYQTHVLISDIEPGEELVRFAEDNKNDEIVIGIRKRSKVGKLMFGSTAQYVILNAPCPVVTIK